MNMYNLWKICTIAIAMSLSLSTLQARSKFRWKWKKKRTRRLQKKRRKMRQRSKWEGVGRAWERWFDWISKVWHLWIELCLPKHHWNFGNLLLLPCKDDMTAFSHLQKEPLKRLERLVCRWYSWSYPSFQAKPQLKHFPPRARSLDAWKIWIKISEGRKSKTKYHLPVLFDDTIHRVWVEWTIECLLCILHHTASYCSSWRASALMALISRGKSLTRYFLWTCMAKQRT